MEIDTYLYGFNENPALEQRLVCWFAFLGPLGNLIPVPGAPAAFRFYYLLLVPAIFLFFWKGLSRKMWHLLLILFPSLLYMFISSVDALLAGFTDTGNGQEGNPVVRVGLFLVLLLFTLCAGDHIATASPLNKLKVVTLFLKGYFVSLFVGYVFFIGYYAHVFTPKFLEHFEILVQWSFGLLRFSPGSYPNEYGIVSSFALSILTFYLAYRKRFAATQTYLLGKPVSTLWLVALFLLTLGALFLATTRAAYVAYLGSLVYISTAQGRFEASTKILAKMGLVALLLFACIQPFFDAWGILKGGYYAFFDRDSFANGRVAAWQEAFQIYHGHEYFGTGFGSVDMIHNVYLQMFFGLGLVGFSLLILTAVILFLRTRSSRPSSRYRLPEGNAFDQALLLNKICGLAVLHVTWFALSNHNLNHFLTWFMVLTLFLQVKEEPATRFALSLPPDIQPVKA